MLFVHGLAVTEAVWSFPDEPGVSYGELLRRDVGLTPLYLRYNTGLHISENGKHLDTLLQQLVTSWPVAVTRITLIGHSMGGLVVQKYLERHAAPLGILLASVPPTGVLATTLRPLGIQQPLHRRRLDFFRKSQGWGWNPLIGITFNGFPVGLVIVVIVGLLYLGGR